LVAEAAANQEGLVVRVVVDQVNLLLQQMLQVQELQVKEIVEEQEELVANKAVAVEVAQELVQQIGQEVQQELQVVQELLLLILELQ
jgi:hypothetical protein